MSIASILTIPASLSVKLALASVMSFLVGETVSGSLSGGVVGAVCGAIAYIIGHLIAGRIALKKQEASDTVSIDRERDAVMERMTNVHLYEVKAIRALNAEREKFYKEQILYHEQLHETERERLHFLAGEMQGCLSYIGVVKGICDSAKIEIPQFTAATMKEMAARFPLPKAPRQALPEQG